MEWFIWAPLAFVAVAGAAGGFAIGYLVGWDKATAYWIAFMKQHDR